MRRLQPTDIPPAGRYDFIVTAEGDMKNAFNETVPAIRCMIDVGPYAGKHLATSAYTAPKGSRFSAHVEPSATGLIDGQWANVPLDWKDGNPRIRYDLSDFRAAQDEPQRAAKSRRTTFHRRTL